MLLSLPPAPVLLQPYTAPARHLRNNQLLARKDSTPAASTGESRWADDWATAAAVSPGLKAALQTQNQVSLPVCAGELSSRPSQLHTPACEGAVLVVARNDLFGKARRVPVCTLWAPCAHDVQPVAYVVVPAVCRSSATAGIATSPRLPDKRAAGQHQIWLDSNPA